MMTFEEFAASNEVRMVKILAKTDAQALRPGDQQFIDNYVNTILQTIYNERVKKYERQHTKRCEASV